MYNSLKKYVARFSMTGESAVISPLDVCSLSILFFFWRQVAFRWKYVVFLSPAQSHETRDLSLHRISSFSNSSSSSVLICFASLLLAASCFKHIFSKAFQSLLELNQLFSCSKRAKTPLLLSGWPTHHPDLLV